VDGDLKGTQFTEADLSGAVIRSCNLEGLRVVDSLIVDVDISGEIDHLVVNDVDVTEYVQQELERRYPHRVQLRTMQSSDDFRAMWATIEKLWGEAVERAQRLPEAKRQERVNDEWSLVETLRHLIFATDAWAFRTVLDEELPFHPLALTQSGYPPETAKSIGMDVDARPSFDEVLPVRLDTMARVRVILDGLDDAGLERVCTRSPAPLYEDEPRTVGECLRVVMNEEVEHLRYATRDLTVLET
jgi:hypothetical protein